jgi:hypothetical protein
VVSKACHTTHERSIDHVLHRRRLRRCHCAYFSRPARAALLLLLLGLLLLLLGAAVPLLLLLLLLVLQLLPFGLQGSG